MWINPLNPRFRRGVKIVSVLSSGAVGLVIFLSDHGPQDHALSHAQVSKVEAF